METIDYLFWLGLGAIAIPAIVYLAIEVFGQRRMHPIVALVQVAGILLVAGCWIALRGLHLGGQIPTINIPPRTP